MQQPAFYAVSILTGIGFAMSLCVGLALQIIWNILMELNSVNRFFTFNTFWLFFIAYI